MPLINIAITAAFQLSATGSVAESQNVAPSEAVFQLGYATIGVMPYKVEFYTRSLGGEMPVWIIRRTSPGQGRDEHVTLTTDETCPIIRDVALSAANLQLGPLRVSGEADRPRLFVFPQPTGPATNAQPVILWGSGQVGDGFAQYRIEASTGTLVEWAQAANSALDACPSLTP